MHPRIQMFLQTRARARVLGDMNLERCMNVELQRLGYRDQPIETAVPDRDEFERAVPQKGGRPKLPRCEHGKIVGRCVDCDEDEVA